MAERKAPLMARRRTIGEDPLDILMPAISPAARAGRDARPRTGTSRRAPAAAVEPARSVRATFHLPAALVNESFMKLIRQRKAYDNRGQFFAIATRSMLRVLVDYRRKRKAAKRGGADTHITLVLDEHQVAEGRQRRLDLIEVEQLTEALEKLESLDPRKADVVKMRVVWGLDITAIANSLDVSRSTVERDWRFAKAWLADEVDQMDH